MIRALICSFIATILYEITVKAPKRSYIVSAAIACVGYASYYIIVLNHNMYLGYFVGTALITFLGELAARILKMQATVFLFPAVIPLVPGIGLYKTMLQFVRGNLMDGISQGVTTLLSAGTIALTMAVVGLMSQVLLKYLFVIFDKRKD